MAEVESMATVYPAARNLCAAANITSKVTTMARARRIVGARACPCS